MSHLKWVLFSTSIVFFILTVPLTILLNSPLPAIAMTPLGIVFLISSFYLNFKERGTKNAVRETIIYSFIPWLYLIMNKPKKIQVLVVFFIPFVLIYGVLLPISGYVSTIYEESFRDAISTKNSSLVAYILTVEIVVPLLLALILLLAVAAIYNKIKKFSQQV